MPAVAREGFGPCVGPGRSPEGLGEPMEARRRAPRVPLNRSRAGIRPISVRNRTDLDEEGAPSTLDTSANVKQTAHVKDA